MRWSGVIPGGLLALVIISLLVLHTPPVKRYALKQVQDILRNQGVQFEATGLDYNLLKLTLSLRDVVIRSTAVPDLPALVRIKRVSADLALWQLLRGFHRVEDVQLSGVNIHLVLDEQGRDNIPKPPVKESTGEPLQYLIGHARIDEGALRVEDRRRQIDSTLPLWQVTVDGNPLTRVHHVRFNSQTAGQVRLEQRTLAIGDIHIDALLGQDAIDLNELRVRTEGSILAISGRLTGFSDPSLDTRLEANLDLAPLAKFAGVSQRIEGTLNAQIGAKGPLSKLEVQANVKGDDLTVHQFHRLDLDLTSTYSAGAQRVYVKSLSVASPSGTIQGNGIIALNADAGRTSLNVAVRNLDLERLSRGFDLPVVIASRANAQFEASWPGLEYEQAAGGVKLQITRLRPQPAENVLPVAASLTANIAGRTAQVRIANLEALAARGSGRVTVDTRERLDGGVQIEIQSVGDLLGELNGFLGRTEPLAGGAIDGPATLAAGLGGTIGNPLVAAQLSSPRLEAGRLKEIVLNVNAAYTRDRLILENAAIRWREQSITASGTVGLKGSTQELDVEARVADASIADVLSGLGSDIPAAGTVNATITAGGTTKNPLANVEITASSLQAYGESFGDLIAQASLENSLLTVSRIQLDKSGSGSFTASGTYNLESRAFTLQAEAPDFRIRQMTLPGGVPVQAEIDLSAQGSGIVNDPNVDAKLDVSGLRVNNEEISDLSAAVKVANRTANLQFRAPRYRLLMDASAGIGSPNPVRFEIRMEGFDLATLPVKLEQPLEGTVTATVTGAGEVRNWKQGQAKAEIAQLDLKWNGQPIRSDGPIQANYSGGVLTVAHAAITAADSRIAISGAIPVEPAASPGNLTLRAGVNLEGLTPFLPPAAKVQARGQLTIDGQLRGTLQQIDPTAAITLQNGYLAVPALDPPVENATLKARLENGRLLLQELGAQWAGSHIQATADVPLGLLPDNLPVQFPRAQGPAQLTAEVNNLQLESIGQVPEKVGGRVSLRLEAQAPRPELNALTARLTFSELRLNLSGFEMSQPAPSMIVVEDGKARIEQFALTGPETRIELSGTAGLDAPQPLDLKMAGDLDAAILTFFTGGIRTQGRTSLQLAVTGTAADPRPSGFVQLADGQFSIPTPRIQAENLNLRLDLEGREVTLSRLDGTLNGGTLAGSGSLQLAGDDLENVKFRLKAADVYLEFPDDMRTVSSFNLNLNSQGREIVLGGQVTIHEGSFTRQLNLDEGVLAYLQRRPQIDLTEERNPMLSRLRFQLDADTDSPFVIDNNLMRAAINVDVRLLGTYYQPGMSGRITLEEGGELYLNERTYLVERGVITFTGEQRIEPSLDILAQTKASGYDITLQIAGDPGDTKTTLTSDPPLPEPDILAVLLTGRTLEEVRGAEVDVAKEQMLSYLAGRVSGTLGSSLERTLGLSEVRIEPSLIAAEDDPTARLTVGQDITNDLKLIYSMDLSNSSDQIWIGQYDITKRFQTQVVRQQDNSYRMEFRHDLQFGSVSGAEQTAAQRLQRKVGNVSFQGNTDFSTQQLAGRFKVKQGNDYDFFKVRRGLDRLESFYANRNLLESQVRMSRQVHDSTVDLTVNIEQGPAVQFVYEGWDVPGDVRDRIRELWKDGVFDAARADDAMAEIRNALIKDGFVRGTAGYRITFPAENRKRVLFEIQPGLRYRDVKLVFEGAGGIESSTLEDLIGEQDMEIAIYTDPNKVTDLLTRYYREQGYLDAKVDTPRSELDEATRTGRVVVPITEGPLYKVGNLAFTGNSIYETGMLRREIPLQSGAVYKPDLRERSIEKLEELYQAKAYNDAEFSYTTEKKTAGGVVNLVFQINENRQSIVREIVVTGNDRTSQNLIRTQVAMKPGDPLTLTKLAESRRNLYNTGAFSVVYIEREDVEVPDAPRNQRPMRLLVKVHEVQPFRMRYGGFFDTERGPGVIADISNRNSLGSARVVGLRTRYDSDLQEARLYFSQPLLRRFPVQTTFGAFARREIVRNTDNGSDDTLDGSGFNTDRVGISIQQESHLGDRYILSYGYRMENTRTYLREQDPLFPFDVRLRIAPLTAALTRDTRDDMLDATRGSFMSHALEYAPESLGSQLRFVKYFGQYFRYVPLSKPTEIPWSGIRKSRLVYAGAVRVGVGSGLGGQDLVLSERFFAGGGTNMRGFPQNALGPIGALGDPLGGEAMLIVNNEIRMPLISIFDAVGFVDLGNVYRRLGDFDPGEIRKTAGVGLRARTPWFLLRLDYGHKLDRRTGEAGGRLFFSIGQAF